MFGQIRIHRLEKMMFVAFLWVFAEKTINALHIVYIYMLYSPIFYIFLLAFGGVRLGEIPLRVEKLSTVQETRKHIPPNGRFGKSSTQKSLLVGDILVPWRVSLINDFAHIPWEDTPSFPKPPQRKKFLHKLLVKHAGYLPGVCGWILDLMIRDVLSRIQDFPDVNL